MMLLNNIIAKHHHRFLRSRLKNVTAELLRSAQAGARPNQSTDFVTHTTLTYLQDLKRRGATGILLFLDLRDAFYTVVLQFIYRLPTTVDELVDILNQVHIPDVCPQPSRPPCRAHHYSITTLTVTTYAHSYETHTPTCGQRQGDRPG